MFLRVCCYLRSLFRSHHLPPLSFGHPKHLSFCRNRKDQSYNLPAILKKAFQSPTSHLFFRDWLCTSYSRFCCLQSSKNWLQQVAVECDNGPSCPYKHPAIFPSELAVNQGSNLANCSTTLRKSVSPSFCSSISTLLFTHFVPQNSSLLSPILFVKFTQSWLPPLTFLFSQASHKVP